MCSQNLCQTWTVSAMPPTQRNVLPTFSGIGKRNDFMQLPHSFVFPLDNGVVQASCNFASFFPAFRQLIGYGVSLRNLLSFSVVQVIKILTFRTLEPLLVIRPSISHCVIFLASRCRSTPLTFELAMTSIWRHLLEGVPRSFRLLLPPIQISWTSSASV